MPFPVVPVVAGVAVVAGAIALRARSLAIKAKGGADLPPSKAAGSATQTPASKAILAAIPPVPGPAKLPDGRADPADLARSIAAEKIRAAQLTTDQLRAIEANAVPGKNVAEFNGNGTAGGTPLPAGTFNPGDIIATDHVSINIRAAGLNLPSDVTGDLLIRCTQANTESSVRGVSIDPRFVDNTERDFPLAAVTGVGPVNIP